MARRKSVNFIRTIAPDVRYQSADVQKLINVVMWRGKKTMQPKMILWGGILIVLSYWIFSIGGNDEVSKEAIKSIISTTTGQSQQP